MAAGNYPFVGNAQTFQNDFAINNANPGMEYGGTENGALYYEDREIAGAMYRVQNATYNKISQSWVLINPALPAYGTALLANGTTQFLTSPAGTSPFTSWTIAYSTTNTGVSTISPTVSTLPSGADLSGVGIFNVKHYNATGNGVTDDTVAIQAALNAAGIVGGRVLFPPGTYIISAPLNVPAFVVIMGCGRGATIIRISNSTASQTAFNAPNGGPVNNPAYYNPTSTYAFQAAQNATDVVICDLTIDGNYRNMTTLQAQTNAAGCINPYERWVIARVQFYDSTGYPVYSQQGNDILVDTCSFELGSPHPDCIGGNPVANSMRVVGCHWKSTMNHLHAVDFVYAAHALISDCFNESPKNIILEACSNSIVERNYFTGAGNIAVQSDTLYSPPTLTNSTNCMVRKNILTGGGQIQVNTDGGSNGGTVATKMFGNSVVSNIVSNANNSGIAWSGDDATCSNGGGIIADNIVLNANASNQTADGFFFQHGKAWVAGINVTSGYLLDVHDNHCIDSRVTPQQRYGIYVGRTDAVQGGNENIRINGGTVSGFVTGGFLANNLPANTPLTITKLVGYNPVGQVTAPTMPANGVFITNPFGVDATVFITGGTVTQIAVGGSGKNTGVTSGTVRVPANQSIGIGYSSAPTWTWFLD